MLSSGVTSEHARETLREFNKTGANQSVIPP